MLTKFLIEPINVLVAPDNRTSGDKVLGRGTRRVVNRAATALRMAAVTLMCSRTVVATLSQHVRQLPATLRHSLTWDRGLGDGQHQSFTMATDVQVYFCDPQSPWQLGSNENTNGLLRQYRPRKTWGFQTQADRQQASVSSPP